LLSGQMSSVFWNMHWSSVVGLCGTRILVFKEIAKLFSRAATEFYISFRNI
jgi:hypothetical protein